MTTTTPEVRMHAPVGGTVAFAIVVSVVAGVVYGLLVMTLLPQTGGAPTALALLVAACVATVVAIALGIVYAVWWHRQGGVRQVAVVSAWIREGTLPVDQTPDVAVETLSRRLKLIPSLLRSLLPGGIWILFGLGQWISAHTPIDHLFAGCLVGLWVVALARSIVLLRRTKPRIERLLAEAKARLAVQWSPPQS